MPAVSLSVPSSLHALKVGRRDCRVPFDDSSSGRARSPVGPVQRYSVLCVNLPCRSHLTVLTLTYEPRPFFFFPLASFHQPGSALDLMYLTFRKQGIRNRLTSESFVRKLGCGSFRSGRCPCESPVGHGHWLWDRVQIWSRLVYCIL